MNQIEAFAQFWRRRLRALTTAATVLSFPARQIVRRLQRAGALTPATAQPYRPQSVVEEHAFLRLLRAGIIREATPGRYFLDQRRLDDATA